MFDIQGAAEMGIFGIFTILAVKAVLDFLTRPKKSDIESVSNALSRHIEYFEAFDIRLNEFEKKRDEVVRQIDDVHEWHKPDNSGQQHWRNKHIATVLERLSIAATEAVRAKEILDRLSQSATEAVRVADQNATALERLLVMLERIEHKLE
jgi:hypothetical protein